MTKKRSFVIAKIEEELEKQTDKSKFATPYGGTNTKDEIVYPHVKYDNDGKQYKGLNNSDDLNIISPEKIKESKEEKYNPDRIPSYYRREGDSGIKKSNLADLKGESNREEELERNRRNYGSYYRDYQENIQKEQKNIQKEQKEINRVEVDTEIKNPLYEQIIYDDNKSDEGYNNYIDNKETNYNDNSNNQYKDNGYSNIESDKIVKKEEKEPTFKHVDDSIRTNQEIEKEKVVNISKGYEKTKSTPSVKTFKKSDYIFPPLDLLKSDTEYSNSNVNEINYQISVIDKELEDFKIGGKVIAYTKGPTVTQFEVKLDPGVNVNKIGAINKNLQMDLKCTQIRIEAPIPGKDTVGIEVPNITKDTILFGNMIAKDLERIKKSGSKTRNGGKPLDCVLGLSISGEPISVDISDMPHGIVAGTTGSGKTICLYSMILSMLYKATPEEVKIILIDPKRNEFTYFEDIPHLATPIIDDPKLASATLKWCADEMDRRFDFLKANRKRAIGDYNDYARENGLNILPYIVVIIDEFADLMNTASDSLETVVQRLTQKARSAGIHLIISTQRPSTDVISGTIKNNISCRIALAVKSYVDSQTILDHSGAEKLLGKGDMLLSKGNNDIRIQGAFISSKELDNISQYFIDSNFKTEYMFTHDDIRKQVEQTESSSANDIIYDPMFEEVARFVFRNRKCSANQIQTTYEMGFNKANRIINALAQLGIVSSQNIPGKAREVIVNDIEELEDILLKRYE